MSGAPVSDVKKKLISLCLKCFFFPFGTEPYLAIKLFAKRKQLIRMVAKTGGHKKGQRCNAQSWTIERSTKDP